MALNTHSRNSEKANAADALAWQIKHMAPWLPEPKREVWFHPERHWRLDFGWPAFTLGIEIDGGIWKRSVTGERGTGHTGTGHIRDIRKGNDAIEYGWRVLHFIPDDIVDKSGRSNTVAIDKIVAVFEKVFSIRKEQGT